MHTCGILQSLIVPEKSNFTATDTIVCQGDSVLLQPFGFNASNVIAYKWFTDYGTDTARVLK